MKVGKSTKRFWIPGRHSAAVMLSLMVFLLLPGVVLAESFNSVSTPRFTLYIPKNNNSHVKQSYNADRIAEHSIEILDDTYEELSRIFNTRPKKKVVLRFLTSEEFKRQTGAPAWTSAMYFRNEITIPLSTNRGMNQRELERALRHEYVHAVIAELSGYRCPAWLDEGVAQFIEGHANPLLGPALREWISDNDAMPLAWLKDGFTGLNSELVPAAYAQSLFAARNLINSLGFSAVTEYLNHLKTGEEEEVAFRKAFGKTKEDFEISLTDQIERWSHSSREDP